MAKSRAHSALFRQVLRQFALFAVPVRVVIFQRLGRAPGTAGDLARYLPVSRSAIVQHLKLLESAGLVDACMYGRRRVYRARAEGLAPLTRWIEQHSHDATTR